MDKTMLIVDDGAMNREMLRNQFCQEFHVLEAQNGEEALQIVKEQKNTIDIVLLDLMMPEMSGIEVLKQRKQLEYFQKIPVIVITGSGSIEDQVAAFEEGASDFVSKPFTPQIVATRVKNVLASKQQLDMVEMEARKLKMKAEKDEMTGLFNKATTEMMVHEIVEEGQGALHALMIFDIDNFKTVNDTLGHPEGDRVIQMISLILSSQFRKTDVIGRIGGDEFCVLMRDVSNKEIVYQKIRELLQLMEYKPGISIPEYVTLSIGLATTQDSSVNGTELLQRADEALYLAKRGGKARYREYGVEVANDGPDNRNSVVVISSNRGLCSMAHAVIPTKLKIIEVPCVEAFSKLCSKDQAHIQMCLLDISEETGDLSYIWQELQQLPWVSMDRVYAICQEGSKKQYVEAMQHGVRDLVVATLEMDYFKARIEHIMKQLGILES